MIGWTFQGDLSGPVVGDFSGPVVGDLSGPVVDDLEEGDTVPRRT